MFFFATTRATPTVETEIPESEWVARAARGDEEAFVHLAASYRPRIWATASRFARSRPELEDLVQDLLVKLWRGLPGYRSDAPFEHWVMTVTVRGCYDFLRSNRRRRESETLVDPAERREDRDPGDERARSRREAWETVRLLLDRLEAKDRLVITLLDLEERGVRETAALTGWSEANVKVRAHRARKKMRECLQELGIEP
ncbi:MAG: sigma-70 family RNA polymerase sigma factor [Verrucomicrobia bacterium]|jgi:RNA polymerase sigma-70 factor (ECF subfamily)|nr:sigma-70 family RNA polymerase sigma factor [Verrucomicrobiota bacterium]